MRVAVPLAQYKRISQYVPRLGDFIIWHGWLRHFYAVICGIDNDDVVVMKSSMPILLFTSNNTHNNTSKISLQEILQSRGTYAVLQNQVWYL